MNTRETAVIVSGAIEAARLYLDYANRAARGELTPEQSQAEWDEIRQRVNSGEALWARAKQIDAERDKEKAAD